MRYVLLVQLVLLGLPGLARAQPASPYTPWIGGVPVSCTSSSGMPVAFVPNTSLADVGLSFPAWPDVPSHVEYNPGFLARLPPGVQLFWFGHVCAHQALAEGLSEELADCGSIQLLKQQGLVSREQVVELQAYLLNAPVVVPWGHRPGPTRAGLLLACYDRAPGARVFNGQSGPVEIPKEQEYQGVKRWRFCSYIPGVSAPTSSGHVTQDSCEKERTKLQRKAAGHVVSACVLTASERCRAAVR
ncbi:hypothetical protein [Archangium lipolyticum]|uniref:hypothetical protein n=1 Tax=Archangium lipolyticum TaxID=2970465 RepID=UPI00214A724A|nr:hypothetical protein [Archangium lipolyticum]